VQASAHVSTHSAAGATAYACGKKSYNGAISVVGTVSEMLCALLTWACACTQSMSDTKAVATSNASMCSHCMTSVAVVEAAQRRGMPIGIIST
jgi:alkaline phosphatase